jgi:hypothetical protein
MIDIEAAIDILQQGCECEDDIPMKCPNCQMADLMRKVTASNDGMKQTNEDLAAQNLVLEQRHKVLQMANRNLSSLHNVNIESLQLYWHKLHPDCPCILLPRDKRGLLKNAKCKSPWRTIEVPEGPPVLSRSEEITKINEHIAKKGVIRGN